MSSIDQRQGQLMKLICSRVNTAEDIAEVAPFTIVREQVADIGHGFVMDDYMMVKDVGLG